MYAATNDTDFVSVCETEPKGYVYRSLLAGNQLELPAKKEGYSKFVAKDGQRVITIDKNVVLIEEVDASILTGYAYYFESEADTTSLVEEISMLIWRSADEH